MPLPKALKRGASKAKKKKVVTETMHDLKHGPHHKDRTHKQEVAIAMKQSGQSYEGAKHRIKKASKRKTRNKGRH